MAKPRPVHQHVFPVILAVGVLLFSRTASPRSPGARNLADFVDCVKDEIGKRTYGRSPRALAALRNAETILGRALSPGQERVLIAALREEEAVDFTFTPTELKRETDHLLEQGFSEDELKKLRRGKILTNWVTENASAIPRALEVQEIRAVKLDEVIGELIEGKSYPYVIDQDGHIILMENDPGFSEGALRMARHKGVPEAHAKPFLIKMAGTLKWDKVAGVFRLKPNYGVELAPEETESALAELRQQQPRMKFIQDTPPAGLEASKAMDCLEILSKRKSGSGFTLGNILASNVVWVGVLGVNELGGAGRTGSEKGREVLLADWAGMNASAPIDAFLRKKITLSSQGRLASFFSRETSLLTITAGNKYFLYPNVLQSDDRQERSSDIAAYDSAWGTGRNLMKVFTDPVMVHDLPLYLAQKCAQGHRLIAYVGNNAVRIVENGSMTILYYAGRKAIIDE